MNPTFHWGNSEETHSLNMRILGNPYNGTLAQYVCIPVDRYVPVDPAMLAVAHGFWTT
jgi:hypothetical protein